MDKTMLVTGLDIGSSKIAAVTARVGGNGFVDIVSQATGDSAGVDRGIIVDLNDSVGAVSKVLSRLKSAAPRGLGEIFANISARDVKGSKSFGMVPISLRGREIIGTDIARSVNAASTIHLPFDREIIHKIVHSFSIDDQPWIRNPLGLYASRLACEAYVVTANVNHIQSIYKCVNDAGYDVKEVIFTGIADGLSLADIEARQLGTVIADIGSSITEVSVFLNGALEAFYVTGFGGRDAGDDFRASEAFNDLIAAIASAVRDLETVTGKAPTVTVTGGFALTDGVIEYLEEKLSSPVRIGALKHVSGSISGLDGVRLATAIGLCRYAYEQKADSSRAIDKRVKARVAEIFNNYF